MRLMRKPLMTKKTSTPKKPPGKCCGQDWNATTDTMATARRPSMSALYGVASVEIYDPNTASRGK